MPKFVEMMVSWPPQWVSLTPQSKEVAGGDCYLTEEEHQKLLEIVRLQSLDIATVRGEIQLLQYKGGHILPPTQPPAPPQN